MQIRTEELKVFLNKIGFSLLFFYLFIFCLPFFKRIEIESGYSYLDGRFIDYLTYLIYGSDLFFVLVLSFWIIEILLNKKRTVFIGDLKIFFSWIAIILFSCFSLFFAESISIGFYYILNLIWIFLIYLFVINKIRDFYSYFIFLNVFVFTIFLQGILAIAQFIKNGSIGFHLLGEQYLSPEIAGVAKTVVNGAKHIRPYGTFSHPNVLALFLLVAGLVALYLFFSFKEKKYRIYLSLVIAVLSVALFLTFSRIAWVAGLIFWGMYVVQENKKTRKQKNSGVEKQKNKRTKKQKIAFLLFCFFAFLAIIVYLAPAVWWRINPFLDTTWESFQIRWLVIEKSWILIKNHFFGIGIGNFVIEIAYLLTGYPVWMAEPPHNTFILILTEIGILGLVSFLSFLYFIGKNLDIRMHHGIVETRHGASLHGYVFALFIFLMFFDHYFWDLRQAQILLMVFVGVIVGYSFNRELQSL